MTEPLVIFLDEPTRVSMSARNWKFTKIINQLTDAGKAVVLVSSELRQLIGMSDRILMLHEGPHRRRIPITTKRRRKNARSRHGQNR